MQTESANHADSTDDAQEKFARSYKLEFAPTRRKYDNRKKDSIHIVGKLFKPQFITPSKWASNLQNIVIVV